MIEIDATTPTFSIQNIATQAVIATHATLPAIVIDLMALRATLADQISIIDPDGFIVPLAVIAPIIASIRTQLASTL